MRRITAQSKMTVILILLVLAVSSSYMVNSAQAQCSVRNDWGTYIVTRGDTLYRIALRFRTTISALVQGNCLPNANLILVGQHLRVPASGSGNPPPPGGGSSRQFTTGATFQQFENGFMVWRSDNAEIRVYVGALAGDADSIGELSIFPAYLYGWLPSQSFTAPSDRVAPILGFGKVWSNFPSVRQRLGWAITPEQSHTMTIQVNGGSVVGFTIPGRWVNYHQGSRWTVTGFSRPTSPPTPIPTPIGGSIDCFLPPYKSGSGINVGSSVVAVNVVPIQSSPPPRGTQIGNLAVGEGAVVIGGPHCFAVDNQHVRAWRVRAFQFTPTEIEGYVLEYAVDNNGRDITYLSLAPVAGARIVSFTAEPNPAEPGGSITVSWQVEGTQYALLTVLDSATNQPLAIVQELSTTGTTTVQVPATGTSEIRLILHAANLTTNYPVNMYARLAEATITVSLAKSQARITTQAAFQQYYQGFMIWRADTGAIYVFGLGMGSYPQSSYAGLPDNDCAGSPPPAGFVCPINGFGRVWANNTDTRQYMGWATAPEQSYQATIVMEGGNPVSITLPDGRTVYIENGTTWHF